MIITARIKPGSREEKIEVNENGEVVIRVRARAIEGKANSAIITLLADHFNVPKGEIKILTPKSRQKRISLPIPDASALTLFQK